MARLGVLIGVALLSAGCLVAKKDVNQLRSDLADTGADVAVTQDTASASDAGSDAAETQGPDVAARTDTLQGEDGQDATVLDSGGVQTGDTASECPGSCDDGDPCTVDSCKRTGVCNHAAGNDGALCAGGTCAAGKCSISVACGQGTIAVPIDDSGKSAVACAATAPVWGNQSLSPQPLASGPAGTATDKLTKLVWQAGSTPQPLAWSAAGTYCDGLVLGERSDWRLPTIVELSSLLNRGKASGPPAWDAVAFSASTTDAPYWSATGVAGGADLAWVVDAKAGATNASQSKPTALGVKCVAGSLSSPGAQFQPAATEVVDTYTKLTWQRTVSTTTYVWSEANSACTGLGAGWRLPEVVELQGIVDFQKAQPAIDGVAFPACPTAAFWTATAYATTAGYAWTVNFATGQVSTASAQQKRQVRCVK